MRIQGYFSLNWNANGLRYGIGHEIRTWMSMGFHAVVNGSREYLPTALELFPDALVICITAPVETIRNRLQQRARESGEKIEKRIQRSSLLTLPTVLHVTTIVNDGTLSVAGDRLLQTLLSAKSGIPA
jgi:ribose 1,5-bisphosphokinase